MIYLDYAATTPLDPRVREAMLPWLEAESGFGNPASDHALGRQARLAVEQARAQLAALLGASVEEIIWTSGATESNNLAIKGALEFRGQNGAHVISSRIEHKSVLDTLRYLETRGLRVSYLTPQAGGLIEVEQVLAALRPDTALVSLMWVNNETGAINPIVELAPLLRACGVLLHVDAVQAAGKLPIDLAQLPVDLLSVSAHKLYGPKGVGALFVRKRPRARLSPQIHGGGHEQGMRSGTLATHQLVGFGAACALTAEAMPVESQRLRALRERLREQLQALPGVLLNAPEVASARAPGILNLSFAGVEGESLRALLPELMLSSGSACSSATREPSYVLRALGRDDELAGASLRLSLGRYSDEGQVDAAAAQIRQAVQFLRQLTPGVEQAAGVPAPVLRQNVYAYPEAAWQRFARLQHHGRLSVGPDVIEVETDSAASRSRLRLQVQVAGRGITAARFQAHGCPMVIALGEYLAARLEQEGLEVLDRLDLPALRAALEIGEDKAHCALMGEDVLQALRREIGSGS